MIAKNILDLYASTVIPKSGTYFNQNESKWRVFAPWQKESHRFQYKTLGYTPDLVLWIPPQNWLVIEFEGTQEENQAWIEDSARTCDKWLKLDYCICDHKGKSPYLWVCNIEGLTNHEQKKKLAEHIIPPFANVDTSNLGKTLVPIIEHPHWKHQNIHQIVQGIPPFLQKNKLPEQLRKITPVTVKNSTIKPNPSSKDKIRQILSTDGKVQKLIAGNLSGYPSPSEARMGLLFCLVGYGLSDTDIHFIMNQSSGLNYQKKAHLQARELERARLYCTRERRILS